LFRHLQQGWYYRLLVWWLLRRNINLQCHPCRIEDTIVRVFSVLQWLISSISVWLKGLYTFFHWCCSQIACSRIWTTWLTWILTLYFPFRLFYLMLKVIIAVTYYNLISIYSEFVYGSCTSLCIIDISRDSIVINSLEMKETVQKTVKTIEI
jgi:hypothetical protein